MKVPISWKCFSVFFLLLIFFIGGSVIKSELIVLTIKITVKPGKGPISPNGYRKIKQDLNQKLYSSSTL